MGKKVLKIFGIVLIVLVILVLIAGVAGWFFVRSKINKINYVEIDKNDLSINEDARNSLEGYRNVALLGVDSRATNTEDSYNSADRTDCIMIASINEETNDVKIFSVYRDTYVEIEGHGFDKITNAYAYGGAQLALKTINKNFDLDIEEFVTFNFDAVAKLVDSVGGIDLDITEEETKYINGYITGTGSVIGETASKITTPGKHHLNGLQAVAYSRIRYTTGGEHKRTERMRTVLNLTFAKVKNLSVMELNNMVDEILPLVYTNVEKKNIDDEIMKLSKYNIGDTMGWPYTTKAYETDYWYGVATDLENNVLKLHREFFGDEDYKVSETVKDISDRIVEETGYTNEVDV